MAIRLFVAMDVPAGLKESLGKAIRETAGDTRGLKWVRLENIHFTLKFLGNVSEDKLERIAKVVSEVADDQEAMELSTGSCGAFPQASRARVFWLGLERGSRELADLARKLDKRLAKLGFAAEKRSFAAHITLARIRQPCDITELLEAWGNRDDVSGWTWRGEELVLYRSVLERTGPTYTALERFKLKG